LADEYHTRYGIDSQHLSAIAELNFRNAKTNPNAQTRAWSHTPESFADDDVETRKLTRMLRLVRGRIHPNLLPKMMWRIRLLSVAFDDLIAVN